MVFSMDLKPWDIDREAGLCVQVPCTSSGPALAAASPQALGGGGGCGEDSESTKLLAMLSHMVGTQGFTSVLCCWLPMQPWSHSLAW